MNGTVDHMREAKGSVNIHGTEAETEAMSMLQGL